MKNLQKTHKIDENCQGKNVQKRCKFFTYAWNDVETMGNHQKFATALDIYFWTSKHVKTHKIDENWEKSHPLTTLFVGFWALESDF